MICTLLPGMLFRNTRSARALVLAVTLMVLSLFRPRFQCRYLISNCCFTSILLSDFIMEAAPDLNLALLRYCFPGCFSTELAAL